MKIFDRTEKILGAENMKKLKNATIAIFGLGGVGSFAAEALCRAGIYNFVLFDKDTIEPSNINRQLIALHSTLGMYKTEAMQKRMLDINPNAKIEINTCFYLPQNFHQYPFDKYDYIIDAVDTVTAKICIIVNAKQAGVPVISCMGMGNKLNPLSIKVADINKTSVCPLAKVMRKELKDKGITSVKTVYSDEQPSKPLQSGTKTRRQTPSSISYVPSVAGLVIASEVVKDIVNK